MANQEHLNILQQGVAEWNRWLDAHPYPETIPNLSGANLQGLDLRGINLKRAYLWSVNLDNTNLQGAVLWKADMCRATLRNADLRAVNLRKANLFEADMTGADLRGANLTGALIVDTELADTDLSGCFVFGCSVWNVNLHGACQKDLIILDAPGGDHWDFTKVRGAKITVDDLEVAQFIYLLLSREKLRKTIDAVTARGVLILGRFGGGGLEVLQSIAAKLSDEGYLPIIFDFERPADRNYTETVKILTGLARFVVVDLSGPSVPQELYATVPHYKIPFVPILEGDRNSYAMFTDILEYPWVLKPIISFANVEDLTRKIPTQIIAPAEEKHKERQILLNQLFS